MRQTLLPDDVWAQLNPRAGALTQRDKRRVAGAVAMILALTVGVVSVVRGGFIRPRLTTDVVYTGTADSSTHAVTETFGIYNNGWHGERVEGVATAQKGLRITAVDGLPTTLPAHTGQQVTLGFTVTDCSATRAMDSALTYRVHRPWGSVSVVLSSRNSSLADMVAAACGR